jgi:hypothetical protein
MQSDPHNPVFELAVKFVNQTSRSVFLTGKAGTGKTTFLKFIRENSFKKIAVTAPTGVAAINAGGTTLHSFFQLPFGPFLPALQPTEAPSSPALHRGSTDNPGYSDPNSLFRNIRFNAAKRELLQELELLIIDEISMVRADTLDAIDTILRHFRQQPLLPFGGLQLLFIGDLYQLPPVVPKPEWELLKHHYSSEYFFDAKVIGQSPPVCLELKKIYRQNEARFIHLLNNIRNNCPTPDDLDALFDHYEPDFTPSKNENYITLTSHNSMAEQINRQELNQLRGRTQTYEASVTGEFNDKAYPAEKSLSLKEGAQIMLIKNDKGETRRYYNGKIGTIKHLTADKITIHFPDEPDELVLEKEIWKNIRYNYDKVKDRVEEEELGSFSQYPIRLAWAITIHKSQGLTFEKAVIDAGDSFAPGQVYVALSRLTSLNGLVLRSRITPFSIRTDPRVVAFTENSLPDDFVKLSLEQEQLAFIGGSLLRAFDWSRLTEQLQDHFDGFARRQFPGKSAAIALAKEWLDNTVVQQETAQKFTRQLEQLLPEAEVDSFQRLQQRTEAAATWFIRLLDDQLLSPLQKHISETKIKQKTKKYLQDLHMLKLVCARKRLQIEDALQLVAGLQKGVGAARLLSSLEEHRKNRESIQPAIGETPPLRPQKGNTHRISLQLYKEGITVAEIATRRGLTATTVESHLASFIPTGEIDVRDLVPEHKIAPILAAIRETGGSTLGPLKSRLGTDFSFGEIRAVLSHLKHTNAAS